MNFTNTDCVKKKVWYHVSWELVGHVYGQVEDTIYLLVKVQVYDHHKSIEIKISQEINK